MKRLEHIRLPPEQKDAVREIKGRLYDALPIQKMILFGSVAAGDFDSESDIDLLILTDNRLTRSERHRIKEEIVNTGIEV